MTTTDPFDTLETLGPGRTIRYDHGTDFTTTPATFRNTLHRTMRNRGWIITTRISGPSVYAEILTTAPPDPAP